MSQPLGEERRVVPFAVPPSRMRRRVIEDGSGGAILLFTGVRYERANEPTQAGSIPGAKTPPSGPRRGY